MVDFEVLLTAVILEVMEKRGIDPQNHAVPEPSEFRHANEAFNQWFKSDELPVAASPGTYVDAIYQRLMKQMSDDEALARRSYIKLF